MACQSYQAGFTCKDGFVQTYACWGTVGCSSCGHVSDRHLPACVSETAPDHLFNDDGSPRFYNEDRPND